MKPRHWLALVFLSLFAACTYRFLGGLHTDIYRGQVVDAERGTPISGAVVTVVWYRAGIAIESSPRFLLNAQETVTDSNGLFSLKVSPGLDWNPLSARLDDPDIVIYKPGYEPLWAATAVDKGFQTIEALASALKAGTTIKLRTLMAAKLSSASYAVPEEVLPGGAEPRDRIPNLMRAINAQRKMAGVQLFPETTQKGVGP